MTEQTNTATTAELPFDVAAINPVEPTPEQAAFLADNFGTAVQIVAKAAVMKGLQAGNLGAALSAALNPIDVFAAIIVGHPAQGNVSRLPGDVARGAADITFAASKAPVQAEAPAGDTPAA